MNTAKLISLLLAFLMQIVYFYPIVNGHIIIYQTGENLLVEEFYDLPASFGPSLKHNGTKYYGIASDPKYGCEALKIKSPKATNASIVDNFVVLIQRKNCSFEEKIRNAQDAKFDAVIIYNYGSEDLEHMSVKNVSGITIPAIFVGETTGIYIIDAYLYGTGYYLLINDELPFNINTHLILPFSILIGLCFIIMIFYIIYKCVREQRRLRQYRLPKRLLKKIPTSKFTKGQPYETCVICLDEFAEGDKIRVLPCSHAYHCNCIDPWLTKNRRVCPICKRMVFARGEARTTRRRQTSSDTMTESDDDTAPLINPVDNSNNHGTFSNNQSSSNLQVDLENPTSDEENILVANNLSAGRGRPRENPFNRNPSSLPNVIEDSSSSRNFWNNISIFRLFRSRSTDNNIPRLSNATPSAVNTASVSVAVNLQTPDSSSNNILNSNLSGSFKEDDEIEPQQSIYEPIAELSLTATTPLATVSDSVNEQDADNLFIQPPAQGGIGVVALPNPNINRSNLPNRTTPSNLPWDNRFML